nr:transposase [Mailhella massiliensis]
MNTPSDLSEKGYGESVGTSCEGKGVKTAGAECCPDHIHILSEIPRRMSVSAFAGYVKGKSSLMACEQFGALKCGCRSRKFWCRGYSIRQAGISHGRMPQESTERGQRRRGSIPYAGSPSAGLR